MKFIANYLTGYDKNGFSVGKYFRKKRIKYLQKLISFVHSQNNRVRILDIGGTSQYWSIIDKQFLTKNNVTIVGVNLQKLQNFADEDYYKHEVGDASTNLWEKFDKNDFDIVHSNSVIEHVGDWRNMKAFAKNVNEFNGYHYIQTPNYWFFIEPHCMIPFFQFLPKPLRVSLVMRFQLGHWLKANNIDEAVEIVDSARLLDKRMMNALFKDSKIIKERFLFFTKSLIAVNF